MFGWVYEWRTIYAQERDAERVLHDSRHTSVAELDDSGAGNEVFMSIAGHVSRAMLLRHSNVRMEAKLGH